MRLHRTHQPLPAQSPPYVGEENQTDGGSHPPGIELTEDGYKLLPAEVGSTHTEYAVSDADCHHSDEPGDGGTEPLGTGNRWNQAPPGSRDVPRTRARSR